MMPVLNLRESGIGKLELKQKYRFLADNAENGRNVSDKIGTCLGKLPLPIFYVT